MKFILIPLITLVMSFSPRAYSVLAEAYQRSNLDKNLVNSNICVAYEKVLIQYAWDRVQRLSCDDGAVAHAGYKLSNFLIIPLTINGQKASYKKLIQQMEEVDFENIYSFNNKHIRDLSGGGASSLRYRNLHFFSRNGKDLDFEEVCLLDLKVKYRDVDQDTVKKVYGATLYCDEDEIVEIPIEFDGREKLDQYLLLSGYVKLENLSLGGIRSYQIYKR